MCPLCKSVVSINCVDAYNLRLAQVNYPRKKPWLFRLFVREDKYLKQLQPPGKRRLIDLLFW